MAEHFDFDFGKCNLEGRVLIYGTFKNKTDDEIRFQWSNKIFEVEGNEYCVFASYLSTDLNDFAEKTGISLEEVEGLSKKLEDKVGEQDYNKKIDRKKWYKQVVRLGSLAEISEYGADTIFAGEHELVEACIKSIIVLEKLYLLRLFEQNSLKKNAEINELAKTYKDYGRKDIKQAIMDKYVLPLLVAKNKNEIGKLEKLSSDFERFCAGAGFEKDSKRLCCLIKQGASDGRTSQLILAYTDKIIAIHCEEYEKADRIVKEIKKMENKDSDG